MGLKLGFPSLGGKGGRSSAGKFGGDCGVSETGVVGAKRESADSAGFSVDMENTWRYCVGLFLRVKLCSRHKMSLLVIWACMHFTINISIRVSFVCTTDNGFGVDSPAFGSCRQSFCTD